MAAAVNPAPPFGLRRRRQALLIIHGIGEQNPYETLDSFARGVFSYLSQTLHLNAKLCPLEIAHKDWTQVGVRIGLFAPNRALPQCPVKDGPPGQRADEPMSYVDVFEYYWAPETEDKLSSMDTLKWVLLTDFTPLRYFADNLQEMVGVRRMNLRSAVWSAVTLYSRELARIFLLYAGLALGVGLLMSWLSQNCDRVSSLKKIEAALLPYLSWTHSLILVLYVAFVLMAWFTLQSLLEFQRHPGEPIQMTPEKIWLGLDILLAALFLAFAVAFERHAGSRVLEHVWHLVTRNGNWKPLVGAAVAALVSYALTAYVADVAVYVNTDAKSKDYEVRTAILKNSTAALKDLLTCGSYDRMVLAGHSLGSVIAYDTINELLSQYNAAPGPAADRPDSPLNLAQLQTLKGLLTFGSPLDKVYYFFREHVKADQAVRAQILSMLHSFRVSPSGRDYGEFNFEYAFRQLDGAEPLVWLNAWSRMDPVSAELKFYLPDDQRAFHYAVPVLAHLSY
jgi:hypothetical protein